MANLHIIGTSHIARQSLKEVRSFIEENKPGIVALELDAKRASALLSKKRTSKWANLFRVGIKGFIFSLLGEWVERKLGEAVGVKPGSEMLLAIKLAKKHKLKIAFIDQDIELTLKKFSKRLSWREKFNFVKDILKAVIFRKSELESLGITNFDLKKVPEDEIIEKLMKKTKERYPNVFDVLVTERNKIMASNLRKLMHHHDENILAIVGAGHKKEIESILRKQDANNISYSYSVNV